MAIPTIRVHLRELFLLHIYFCADARVKYPTFSTKFTSGR